jgi:hypothetical protein
MTYPLYIFNTLLYPMPWHRWLPVWSLGCQGACTAALFYRGLRTAARGYRTRIDVFYQLLKSRESSPRKVRVIEFPLKDSYTALPSSVFPGPTEQILAMMCGDKLYEQFEPCNEFEQTMCWYHRVILHAVEGMVTCCIC